MAAVLVVPSLFMIHFPVSLLPTNSLPPLPLAAMIVLLPQGVEANLPRLHLQAT